MDFEEIQLYCSKKPFATAETPFGPETLVFKVHNKMFALIPLDTEEKSINLKNLPEVNIDLRETYDSIIPGFHMSKIHWNTLYINRGLKKSLIYKLIDESYQIVFESLPKKVRALT